MIRIITVEFDPLKKSFDDSVIAAFLAGKTVNSIEKQFFQQNSKFYWTFVVEYATDKVGGTYDIDLETESQKVTFLALKEWRNELASEKGVPPYLLFTNNQLKLIVQKMPTNVEEMKSIDKLSSKKIQDYSEPILKIIKEQEADEQKPSVPDICQMD